MLSRLEWMTINPKVVLDLGCGPGEASKQLKLRYPKAEVIAIDHCFEMLKYTQQQLPLASQLCADAACLPFADQTIDLIFANFLLPWHDNFKVLLKEWRRVLCGEGLLMFTTLGPDTIKEIHPLVDPLSLPQFLDMHDVGDAILAEKFLDPVLDVTYLTTVYRNNPKLIEDLTASGMFFGNPARLIDIDMSVEPLELTHEIIFAHAFAPCADLLSADKNGEVHLPLSQLKKMLARDK